MKFKLVETFLTEDFKPHNVEVTFSHGIPSIVATVYEPENVVSNYAIIQDFMSLVNTRKRANKKAIEVSRSNYNSFLFQNLINNLKYVVNCKVIKNLNNNNPIIINDLYSDGRGSKNHKKEIELAISGTGKTGSAKLDNYYVHHKNKNEHDNSATNLILIPYGSKSIMSDQIHGVLHLLNNRQQFNCVVYEIDNSNNIVPHKIEINYI